MVLCIIDVIWFPKVQKASEKISITFATNLTTQGNIIPPLPHTTIKYYNSLYNSACLVCLSFKSQSSIKLSHKPCEVATVFKFAELCGTGTLGLAGLVGLGFCGRGGGGRRCALGGGFVGRGRSCLSSGLPKFSPLLMPGGLASLMDLCNTGGCLLWGLWSAWRVSLYQPEIKQRKLKIIRTSWL